MPTTRCPDPDCSVLVIEDDEMLREGLAELFRDEGMDVATAANGREGLEYLRSNHAPHVILLDLMMPVMSGPEFRAEQLGDASLSAIPVIVLSAAYDARKQAAALGAAGYFTKPIKIDKLVAAVRVHC